MATKEVRASLQSIAAVVPNDPGWQASDFIVDDALGQVAQIKQIGGVRFVSPDPAVAASTTLARQILLLALTSGVAAGTAVLGGGLVRGNLQAPPTPAVVHVSLTTAGAVLVVSALTTVVGCTLVSLAFNVAGTSAVATILVENATGAWDCSFTVAAGTNATARVWTNADTSAAIALVIP